MKLKHLFFAVAASTLAAACSEVDELSSGMESKKTLDAIHSGTDRFNTRVNLNSEWESGDAIGVYMLDAGTGDIRNAAMNIQYNADLQASATTTDFVAANGGIGIYDQPCDFYAYYPYSSGEDGKVDAGAGVYSIDLSDQSAGISKHDLMWVKVENQAASELRTDGLAMTFKHQLVLLRVNIKNENVTVESVKVEGLRTAAQFDIFKGSLAVEEDSQKPITLHKVSDKAFVGVMLPAADLIKVMSVTLNVDGKTYQYMVSEGSTVNKFEPGNEYIFNINLRTASGDLIQGGSGSTEGWKPGGSVDDEATETNPAIPSGYETISINNETDLAAVLNNASGKVAMVFASGNSYTFANNLVVPAEVTELMLLGDGNKLVELSMKSIVNTGLQKLSLSNLKITGDANTTLLSNAADNNYGNQFATDAVVEIKKCELTGMKNVFKWDSGESVETNGHILSSLIIDNCYVHDVASVFDNYPSATITLTNSTFYKMSGQAIRPYTSKAETIPDPTITVQNCTLVSLDKTPIEGTGKGCNIIYENNVSALIDPTHSNLSYNTTSSTGDGNYAAKNDDSDTVATGGFKNVTFNTDYTVSTLFTNAANGDLTLLIDVKVGDPRWYKPATE